MDDGQNLANEIAEIDQAVKDATPPELTVQQQLWIDYNALGGIVTDNTQDWTDSEGRPTPMRKMPIIEFAANIGVSRETLRQWRTSIPDFWQRVNDRRKELAPQARLQQIHDKWYLKALKMDNWPVTEAWLINNDPGYKTPKVKVEHEVANSWAALVGQKRKVIDAEVTNVTTEDRPS